MTFWAIGTVLLIVGGYFLAVGGYIEGKTRTKGTSAWLGVVIGFMLVGAGAYLWHLA